MAQPAEDPEPSVPSCAPPSIHRRTGIRGALLSGPFRSCESASGRGGYPTLRHSCRAIYLRVHRNCAELPRDAPEEESRGNPSRQFGHGRRRLNSCQSWRGSQVPVRAAAQGPAARWLSIVPRTHAHGRHSGPATPVLSVRPRRRALPERQDN